MLLLLAVPIVGVPIVLAGQASSGQALVWERVQLTLATVLAVAIALVGCRGATSRAREVRAWLSFAFVAWLAVELLHDLELGGFTPPVPADLGLVVVVAGSIGAFRAALRGRFNRGAELSMYIDAAIVCTAVVAALLALLAGRRISDSGQAWQLLHALTILGTLGATAMLAVAIPPPRSMRGLWPLLLGLGVLGIGYVGQTQVTGTGAWLLFGTMTSIGLLLVAFGGATWTDAVDNDPKVLRVMHQARDLFPLAAVAVVPFILLPVQIVDEDLTFRVAINVFICFIVIAAVARQRLLLRDRDRLLEDARSTLDTVERRARQLGGVEAAGRILALSGPAQPALDAVVGILTDRFGYDHVAIYLGDGATLESRAQHDATPLSQALDGSVGVVGRVVRDRSARLVGDVSVDPDYVVGDPSVRSELCVPLLEGDRLLGVLDVQSSGPRPLDDTDLAVIVAVADRLAGAVALGLERAGLVDEKDFVTAILDAVGAVVIVVGADGRVVRYNRATSMVSGYTPAEIDTHGSLDFLVPPDERLDVVSALSRLQAGDPGIPRENDWVRKDGTRRHIAWSNSAVLGGDDVVRYTIATGIDITERKDLEDELAHKSLHDPITGLPNRRLLMDRLEHALRSRRGAATSLLFIDIDDFKNVNDKFGHDVGDQALKIVAERLIGAVRPGDTVARLSGDEFAVVLEDPTNGHGPDLVAARILDVLAQPIETREHRVGLTVSIGTAEAETNVTSASTLLRNADFAMYAAKLAGGAQHRRYAAEDRAIADDDARLAADLPGAVARGELRVHYQPIVDLRSGTITGVEALVRWQHPERGLLAPGRFIPIAERTGSIVEIGAWVLATACRELKAWQRDTPKLSMAVNLSGRQFESPQLLGHVRGALRANRISPASLILEVTETMLLADSTAAARLAGLKALGVRLAIDDFGTGYSSISYLRRFPVDILKIDREFTDGADSPDGIKLLRGIAQLGRMVGLDLIAEGVERAEQIGPIVAAGCHEAQGFLFARPVDAHALTELLHDGARGATARRALMAAAAPNAA